jgi:hypothetical protein
MFIIDQLFAPRKSATSTTVILMAETNTRKNMLLVVQTEEGIQMLVEISTRKSRILLLKMRCCLCSAKCMRNPWLVMIWYTFKRMLERMVDWLQAYLLWMMLTSRRSLPTRGVFGFRIPSYLPWKVLTMPSEGKEQKQEEEVVVERLWSEIQKSHSRSP